MAPCWRDKRYAVHSRNGVSERLVEDLKAERDESISALVETMDDRLSLALKGKIQFLNELTELLVKGFDAPPSDGGTSSMT